MTVITDMFGVTRVSTSSAVGTCKVCGETAPIVNFGVDKFGEHGYLARHGRRGVRAGAKCRGSFGYWVERKRA